MREIRTSGLMSGEGKPPAASRSRSSALPRLYFWRRQTPNLKKLAVAVGTTIADRPPHRSVRARLRTRLLPRMSGGEANMGIGMQNAGLWNPPVQDGEQTPPTHLGALTATN